MTRHFCDICGKTLTRDSTYYMLSSDRILPLGCKCIDLGGEHYETVPTTCKPYKFINVELCEECYEDLTKYISRKTQDNLKKMVDSWFVEDVKNVGDNEK